VITPCRQISNSSGPVQVMLRIGQAIDVGV
jgi:hypothetical protein